MDEDVKAVEYSLGQEKKDIPSCSMCCSLPFKKVVPGGISNGPCFGVDVI